MKIPRPTNFNAHSRKLKLMTKKNPNRLQSQKAARKTKSPSKLEEGLDYYINDQELLVLTEHYLLNRGYCCGNGCRHCPYEKD